MLCTLVQHHAQRNSVCDEHDAVLKYITPEVYHRIISHFLDEKFNNGPFFLFHLDLHPTNVIANSKWEVEAILDWEFAAALPMEVAFSPPRCIMNQYREEDMLPNSDNYKLYESRLRIFTENVKEHLESSHSTLSKLAPVILTQLYGALSERRAFFAWAASDIRKMFYLLWDHLALTTPIATEKKVDVSRTENVVFQTEHELVTEMLQIMSEEKAKDWVSKRLLSLHEYVLERDGHEQAKRSHREESHQKMGDKIDSETI